MYVSLFHCFFLRRNSYVISKLKNSKRLQNRFVMIAGTDYYFYILYILSIFYFNWTIEQLERTLITNSMHDKFPKIQYSHHEYSSDQSFTWIFTCCTLDFLCSFNFSFPVSFNTWKSRSWNQWHCLLI